MQKEHVKTVIWPRDPIVGPEGTIYSYAIVGMLVTDRPVFEGRDINESGIHQILLDGPCHGIANLLECVHTRETDCIVGDATDVLLSLKDI